MDYRSWFNQTMPDAINRTLKIAFLRSARQPSAAPMSSDCSLHDMIEGLRQSPAHNGPFEDPVLHRELDRLMAHLRII